MTTQQSSLSSLAVEYIHNLPMEDQQRLIDSLDHLLYLYNQEKNAAENMIDFIQTQYLYSQQIFDQYYQYEVRQLLVTHPLESLNEEDGKPFWSGSRKVPTIFQYDAESKEHRIWIAHMIYLRMKAFGVTFPITCRLENEEEMYMIHSVDDIVNMIDLLESDECREGNVLQRTTVPPTEKELIQTLSKYSHLPPNLTLQPQVFEKVFFSLILFKRG
jgi:hypothetical protein